MDRRKCRKHKTGSKRDSKKEKKKEKEKKGGPPWAGLEPGTLHPNHKKVKHSHFAGKKWKKRHPSSSQ